MGENRAGRASLRRRRREKLEDPFPVESPGWESNGNILS